VWCCVGGCGRERVYERGEGREELEEKKGKKVKI
jgi:hypothetical protein